MNTVNVVLISYNTLRHFFNKLDSLMKLKMFFLFTEATNMAYKF
jgi:hypothetical protein